MARIKELISQLLVERSHLTAKQSSALISYRTGDHLKVPDKNNRVLNEKIITKGAYYRVLEQARKNAVKSLFTVILLHSLDIIDNDSWDRMSELSAFLKASSDAEEIDEKTARRAVDQMQLAFDKILTIKHLIS